MGMYDYLHYNGKDYQTKDFDCQMDDFYITAEGFLELEHHIYEDTPIEEKPYPKAEIGSLEYVTGMRRKVSSERKRVEFHGILCAVNKSEDLKFKFTDGKLVDVKVLLGG